MSAVANIVLNDGQATPVSHTFIPLGPTDGVWWFEDQSSGTSSLGFDRISLQLIRVNGQAAGTSSTANRVNRVKMTIHTPTLETLGTSDTGIQPPPTVAYVDRCHIEFILAERDIEQEREDLRVYARGLLDNAQVVAMIEKLQAIY
jgi:hypothetical protein